MLNVVSIASRSRMWLSRQRRLATKGDEIRARIAANRAKRLSIAERIKAEAGVSAHAVRTEDLSGRAWLNTGEIESPEGRNLLELFTLAHEAGHIFLHSDGVGCTLPTHVMELEAESYAHHAFREHGMRVPRRATDWGRAYVGHHILQDRARGFAVDQRALEYSTGHRSPFEPLRRVPAKWRRHPAMPAAEQAKWDQRDQLHLGAQGLPARTSQPLLDAFGAWLDFLIMSLVWGYLITLLIFNWFGMIPWSPDTPLVRHGLTTSEAFPHVMAGSLVWISIASMWRTRRQFLMRAARPRRRRRSRVPRSMRASWSMPAPSASSRPLPSAAWRRPG